MSHFCIVNVHVKCSVCDLCVCVSPDHLWVLLPDVFMVISSEVAVDIVKHAFITKFNEITADVSSLPLPYLIRMQIRTAQDVEHCQHLRIRISIIFFQLQFILFTLSRRKT